MADVSQASEVVSFVKDGGTLAFVFWVAMELRAWRHEMNGFVKELLARDRMRSGPTRLPTEPGER